MKPGFYVSLIKQPAAGAAGGYSSLGLVPVRVGRAGRPNMTVYRQAAGGRTRTMTGIAPGADVSFWKDVQAMVDFMLDFDLRAMASFFLWL
jgi:hypothetical protein